MMNQPKSSRRLRSFIRGSLSINQQLTLLICTLLLSVILIFGCISYLGVRQASYAAGEERLQTLGEQLGNMLSNNIRNHITSTQQAATQPAIAHFIHTNGKEGKKEVLAALLSIYKDSASFQIELLNIQRHPLLVLSKKKEGPLSSRSLLSGLQPGNADSSRVGKLLVRNDSIFYPVIIPVKDSQHFYGYVVRWRIMQTSARSIQQFSKLMGTEAKLYIGNEDGSVWTDRVKPIPALQIRREISPKGFQYTREGDKDIMADVRPLKSTDWLVCIELSKSMVMAASNQFLYWMTLAGLIILLLGIAATWWMSQKLTRPLRELTAASTQIAGGNYSTKVSMDSYNEIGKLSRAFNAMAFQLHQSRVALEEKAENYKILFEHNPMPMWIYSRSAQKILDVNTAAIRHYGYSREEFLGLDLIQLRPSEDVEKFCDHLKSISQGANSGVWKHRKKNGSLIMVNVISDTIIYHGHDARIVLAHDVTEQLKVEEELVNHRLHQQELITETTIQAQEKEREELGRELHDNINQILASTKLYLEMARGGDEEMMPRALTKSYENVNLAISEIRQLSKQLVPPSLHSTLIDAITELIDSILSATDIKILLVYENFDERHLNEQIKLILYRIIQEAMNNILKHAQATHVTVMIENNGQQVSLVISDNGVGFDTSMKSKGIGLRNINNRVKFYKGSASISSFKGKGCKLIVNIPVGKPW